MPNSIEFIEELDTLTLTITESSTNAQFNFNQQSAADNKFTEFVADYDTRDGYNKTIDDPAKKVYDFQNNRYTITKT